MIPHSLSFAKQSDAQDELKRFRDQFIIPSVNGKEAVYFLGNSLGLQPKRTAAYMQQVLDQWSRLGVEGYFTGEQPWLDYHSQLTGPLSQLVGTLPHEVVMMNQLTVNLHLMMVSFYQPSGKRNKIICEAKAFPSDQYMLETHVRQRGLDPAEVIVEINPPAGEALIKMDDILDTIDRHKNELALVLWGGVNYYTGQVFDMEGITKAAHGAGAKAGFDLAHAAGNIPLHLHRWNVDFACWCSYKYLNSGPGAVAGTFVHERYHQAPVDRFAGWWGYRKDKRFLMQKGFEPIAAAEGWQLSNPSPLLLAAHKAALEVFMEAGMEKVFQKGRRLSDYLLSVINGINSKRNEPAIRVLTPSVEKGCQVSLLMLRNGKKVFDHLSKNGVFADWREPDVIRVAPVPLYNTFEEVWHFGQILESGIRDLELV